jgi:GTP cyclohydrolase FolE2
MSTICPCAQNMSNICPIYDHVHTHIKDILRTYDISDISSTHYVHNMSTICP